MINLLKVFMVGAAGYSTLEILFRGYSHWTMAITGGICFLLLYAINKRNEKAPFWLVGLKGALTITLVEFIVGCIVNLWLGWNVWDYTAYPLNVLGQVCISFTALWFVLSMMLPSFIRFLRLP